MFPPYLEKVSHIASFITFIFPLEFPAKLGRLPKIKIQKRQGVEPWSPGWWAGMLDLTNISHRIVLCGHVCTCSHMTT